MALEHTRPELAADIVDKGIVLTGGAHCSPTWLHPAPCDRFAVSIIADDALSCVARHWAMP